MAKLNLKEMPRPKLIGLICGAVLAILIIFFGADQFRKQGMLVGAWDTQSYRAGAKKNTLFINGNGSFLFANYVGKWSYFNQSLKLYRVGGEIAWEFKVNETFDQITDLTPNGPVFTKEK